MSSPNYVEVAYFVKTFGLKGELKLVLAENVSIDFRKLEVIFVKEKGQHIPYFIEKCNLKREEIILSLEDINNPEQAKKLCKQIIYIDNQANSSLANIQNNPNILEGYQAYQTGEVVGVIDRLESYPQQVMAFIKKTDGDEVMIPLNQEFISEIDDINKSVYFDLPDGLLDL